MNAVAEGLLSVAAVVVALTVIFGALWKLYGLTKRIESTIGVDADGLTLSDRSREAADALSAHVDQADKVLQRVDARLDLLEGSVSPKGGPTLTARVDHLESDVQGITRHVDRVGAQVDVLSGLLRDDITSRTRAGSTPNRGDTDARPLKGDGQ